METLSTGDLAAKEIYYHTQCLRNFHNEFNPNTAGVREGQIDPPPPCGFSKNVSSKDRVKPWFFVTFNIIMRHIFPENVIEIHQVVQKL